MNFGEIGFNCPVDGPMTVGIDCIEDMVIHQRGHAEITLRCPKCGTVVNITTPVPIIPRPIVEAISDDFGIPFEDGKLVFSAIINSLGGEMHNIEFTFEPDGDEMDLELLEERHISAEDEQHLAFFSNELAKMESVSDFLLRVAEDENNSDESEDLYN
jgi:hypothetical protein